MKIRLYVSQWHGQVINFISRFTSSDHRANESSIVEHTTHQKELLNSNVDEHEYVMNYR